MREKISAMPNSEIQKQIETFTSDENERAKLIKRYIEFELIENLVIDNRLHSKERLRLLTLFDEFEKFVEE